MLCQQCGTETQRLNPTVTVIHYCNFHTSLETVAVVKPSLYLRIPCYVIGSGGLSSMFWQMSHICAMLAFPLVSRCVSVVQVFGL